MTKVEFLAHLQTALERLPQVEIDQSVAFYAEIIDDRVEDGMSEQEAVEQLGDVNQIAAQIIAETPFVPRAVAKAKSKGTNMTLVIILLVVLSPAWLPLAIALIATIFALIVSAWAVIISLWTVVLSLFVMGLAFLLALFYLIFTGYPLSALLAVGAGLLCLGLGIFAFIGVLALTKVFIKFNVFVARKIKSLFVRQEHQNNQAGYVTQSASVIQSSQVQQQVQQQAQQSVQEANNV